MLWPSATSIVLPRLRIQSENGITDFGGNSNLKRRWIAVEMYGFLGPNGLRHAALVRIPCEALYWQDFEFEGIMDGLTEGRKWTLNRD